MKMRGSLRGLMQTFLVHAIMGTWLAQVGNCRYRDWRYGVTARRAIGPKHGDPVYRLIRDDRENSDTCQKKRPVNLKAGVELKLQ